ncbi:hypothetical protein Tco_1337186 [Tanacetum coccineum]
MVFRPEAQPSNIIQAVEERIKVAIHPEYPEQTIVIGSTLTKEGRKALCDLLRHSLDVFSWKPADMIGVPRHIAEHRLNVREGCSPVRQNKRSQTPERNKAIQEEVEKLVDAGIMKEVHYHSWLSNPIMVEKMMTAGEYKAFQKQIGINLEVYVDDLVIKIHMEHEIIRDMEEAFKTLREINMKLNLKKRTFKIEEGTFLGYKVNTEGIMYRPRTSVEGQILADFIVERPKDGPLDTPMEAEEELPDPWTLFIDGSSCIDGSEAGLILKIRKEQNSLTP